MRRQHIYNWIIEALVIMLLLLTSMPAFAKSSTCSGGKGSPVWAVNKINLNLYVTDTPLWYTPQYGPEVEIRLSYNSQQATDLTNSAFGPKWQFNYQSSLDVSGSNITVNMPDGRKDLYGSNGSKSPTGVFSTLAKTYPANAADKNYTLTFTNGEVYVYDIPSGYSLSSPVLVEIKDAYGKALKIGYAGNKLKTITDALGKTTILNYNTSGFVETVTDPFGRTARFGYTSTGSRINSITDMGGYVFTIGYQTVNGKIYISSIAENGISGLQTAKTWKFKIEPNDGIANGNVLYPAPGTAMDNKYRVTITSPSAPIDGLGNLELKEEYYYAGPYTWYVSPNDYVTYDSTTGKNNYTDAKKTYYYLDRTDTKGRISKIQNPEGGYVEYKDFDADTGKPRTIIDYHGLDEAGQSILHTTQLLYNVKGRVKEIKTPRFSETNEKTSIAYYSNDIDVKTITNGLGTITLTYNGNTHDIDKVTDRMGIITKYAYTAEGKIDTITRAHETALAAATKFIYDPQTFNMTEIRQAGQTVISFTHDSIGRIQTKTDPTGVTLTYLYDNLDRTTNILYPDTVYQSVTPLSKFDTITWSPSFVDVIDSVTDRAGLTTRYLHDNLKRASQVSTVSAASTTLTTVSYKYDKNGNLTKFYDPRNKLTKFEYNALDLPIKKTYPNNKYIQYDYDKMGLLKTEVTARGFTKAYTYDANHNLSTIADDDNSIFPYPVVKVSFTYDEYDRRKSMEEATGYTSYDYYKNNKLWKVNGPDGNDLIVFDYNELGDLKHIDPQAGDTLSFIYDYESIGGTAFKKMGRLLSVQKGTDSFLYGYSGANPLVQVLTRPNGSWTEYQYNDPLKRLTDVINRDSQSAIINSYHYEYNDQDLRGKETITNGQAINTFAAGTSAHTPNNLNQTASMTNPNRSYTYDDDGNMIIGYTPKTSEQDSYPLYMGYDADNRMYYSEYTDGSNVLHTAKYTYNGDGVLWKADRVDGGASTTTKYLRAGWLPIQERNENSAITKQYTWGENMGGGIGGLLNLRQGGQDYSYLYDGGGNVTTLLDSAENVVASYQYDPFGKLMNNPAFNQKYMFSTKEYDAGTGLSYYGYRFYMPEIGKWTTRDPLGEAGGINLYKAMNNSAMNWIDPWGLSTWPTNYRKVTGRYGEKREGNRTHNGLDVRNPKGGTVYASDSGFVIRVWNSGRGGNQMLIRHFDGSVSGYAHSASIVRQGQLVFEGQPIGISDDSGAGPPHLHYTYKPCYGCEVTYDPLEHIRNASMPEAMCR